MKRLAIFAGYSGNEVIEDYVVYYLKQLKKVADIIFVYDNKFSKKELEKIKGLTIHNICEKHGGYDFGSYKKGYLYAKEKNMLTTYDNLIFCNDSSFGPLYNLKPFFNKMDKKKNIDFWGFYEYKVSCFNFIEKGMDYIQSYFLVFKKQTFQNKAFDKFINDIKKEKEKKDVVFKYELGLTKHLRSNNFIGEAFYTGYSNQPFNNKAAKLAIKGFPFIKTALFDVNRMTKYACCYQMKDYYKICKKYTKYDPELINNFLKNKPKIPIYLYYRNLFLPLTILNKIKLLLAIAMNRFLSKKMNDYIWTTYRKIKYRNKK